MGKKIHAGRSRNDQVLVDLKLFLRDELRQTAHRVRTLFDRLQELSEHYRDVLMPGYTHLQVAMPSSFGLWFGAYAETLVDDMRLLAAAYDVANQNPLGSAAGYGSSFPLDRTMTTRLLGFADLNYNVVAAQMSRGKSERAAAAAVAAVAATLGRFAMDVCLYMSQNFGFVSFPDELTTGSSIMPHKKNPDVFEIMRGKCNRLQGVPNEIALLVTNLPLGYHRDLQLLKDILFLPPRRWPNALRCAISCCSISACGRISSTMRATTTSSPWRTSTGWCCRACRSARPTAAWASRCRRERTGPRARCTTPTKGVSAISATTASAPRWNA